VTTNLERVLFDFAQGSGFFVVEIVGLFGALLADQVLRDHARAQHAVRLKTSKALKCHSDQGKTSMRLI
jgi:hypothetical protein